jgi:hypothetical protein
MNYLKNCHVTMSYCNLFNLENFFSVFKESVTLFLVSTVVLTPTEDTHIFSSLPTHSFCLHGLPPNAKNFKICNTVVSLKPDETCA